MKAIQTRYHGPTGTRGSRYSASAEGVGRIYLPTDHSLNSDGRHEAAAKALAAKHGWLRDGSQLVGGVLPDGSMAWVFAWHPIAIGTLLAVKDRFQAGDRSGEVMGRISQAMDQAADK